MKFRLLSMSWAKSLYSYTFYLSMSIFVLLNFNTWALDCGTDVTINQNPASCITMGTTEIVFDAPADQNYQIILQEVSSGYQQFGSILQGQTSYTFLYTKPIDYVVYIHDATPSLVCSLNTTGAIVPSTTSEVVTNEGCGQGDGSVDITFVGETADDNYYVYLYDDQGNFLNINGIGTGGNTVNFSNLSAGDYFVSTALLSSSTLFCDETISFTVEGSATVTMHPGTCLNKTTADITLDAPAPIDYHITMKELPFGNTLFEILPAGSTSVTFEGIIAVDYEVTFKDEFSNPLCSLITTGVNGTSNISAATTDETVAGANDGSVVLTFVGETFPEDHYVYLFDDQGNYVALTSVFQGTNTASFSNLAPDDYYVRVQDQNLYLMCDNVGNFTINGGPLPSITCNDLTLTQNAGTCINMGSTDIVLDDPANQNYSIIVQEVASGVQQFGSILTGQTSATIDYIKPIEYNVFIHDASSSLVCSLNTNGIINTSTTSASVTDEVCDQQDGSVDITFIGETADDNYYVKLYDDQGNLLNINGIATEGNTVNFSGLAQGDYYVSTELLSSSTLFCDQTISFTVGGTSVTNFADFHYVVLSSNGKRLRFYNDATDPSNPRLWDFGDGDFSTNKNPRHKFDDYDTYNVCLTVDSDNGCQDTYCEDVVVSPPRLGQFEEDIPTEMDIETLDEVKVGSIYPNPTTNQLNIELLGSSEENVQLQLFNNLGQLVMQKVASLRNGNTQTINTHSLQPGIYFLNVKTNKSNQNFRVIKN